MAEGGGEEEGSTKRRRIDEWCSAVEKRRQAFVIVGEYLHNVLQQRTEEKKVMDAKLQQATEENKALEERLKKAQELRRRMTNAMHQSAKLVKLIQERMRFGQEMDALCAHNVKELLALVLEKEKDDEIEFKELKQKRMVEMKGHHLAQMDSLRLQHEQRIQEIRDHTGGAQEEEYD